MFFFSWKKAFWCCRYPTRKKRGKKTTFNTRLKKLRQRSFPQVNFREILFIVFGNFRSEKKGIWVIVDGWANARITMASRLQSR